MKFIVHVGPRKTGTTYIQETLAALAVPLLDRGIYLASIWNAAPGIPSHLKLAVALRTGDLALVQSQVRQIIERGYQYVIISSEDLSSLPPDNIVTLRDLLGSASAEVVYYVRRWPERLPSTWQERVKFGRTATLPEFLVEQLTRYHDSEFHDATIIDRFASVFGANHIRIASYSYLVDNGLDIAAHFLASFLGVTDLTPPLIGRVNASLPPVDLELIRSLNCIHARRGGAASPAVRNWYLTNRAGVVPDAVRDAIRSSADTIRLNEASPQFVRLSQDFPTRYASSIVPPCHPGALHELRAVNVPFIRADYLFEPSIAGLLNDIYDVCKRHSLPTE